MKNILVTVDFSKDSMHALEHAIKIINKMGGDLRILHVGADLIAITKLDRGTPGNQSISSAAQQMVNHSPIPVLSI